MDDFLKKLEHDVIRGLKREFNDIFQKENTSSTNLIEELPRYGIDKSQLFPGSVFDSHCHLDFISNRRMRKYSVFSLQDCLDADGLNLGNMFGGCVTNFCDPADWCEVENKSWRPRSKVFKEAIKDKRVFITVGCHPHFADRFTGLEIEQLYGIVKTKTSNSSLESCCNWRMRP